MRDMRFKHAVCMHASAWRADDAYTWEQLLPTLCVAEAAACACAWRRVVQRTNLRHKHTLAAPASTRVSEGLSAVVPEVVMAAAAVVV